MVASILQILLRQQSSFSQPEKQTYWYLVAIVVAISCYFLLVYTYDSLFSQRKLRSFIMVGYGDRWWKKKFDIYNTILMFRLIISRAHWMLSLPDDL